MLQLEVIKSLKDISRKLAHSKITDEEALLLLTPLFDEHNGEDSPRWRVFKDKRMLNTAIGKMGKAHRKRLKPFAERIDPAYFNNEIYWGEIE